MGLRNVAELDTETTDVAVEAAPEVIAPSPEVAAVAAPEIPAANEQVSGAVTVKPSASLPTTGKRYSAALEEFKNLIDPSTLEFDTFKRVTVSLSGFNDQNKVKLGTRIKIELMSYNDRYIVSPGVTNDEANKLAKYSLDGVTLEDGAGNVDDYVAYLKDVEGYKDASKKRYLTIYGFLVAKAKNEDVPFEVIPEEEREIVTVQIPPRSYGKFTGFQLTQGVKIAQGIVQPSSVLELSAKSVAGKSVEYAEVEFKRG